MTTISGTGNVMFFHLCKYQNPKDKMYYVRKFVITSNNELADDIILKLMPSNVIKFLAKFKATQYRILPAFDFSVLDQKPSVDDVIKLRSDILNDDVNKDSTSSYAKF